MCPEKGGSKETIAEGAALPPNPESNGGSVSTALTLETPKNIARDVCVVHRRRRILGTVNYAAG